MPRTVGCVDGTQVKIKAPSEEEWVYVNRKGQHSINVQVNKHYKHYTINTDKVHIELPMKLSIKKS